MAFIIEMEPATLLASVALLAGAIGAIYGSWAHKIEQRRVREILDKLK